MDFGDYLSDRVCKRLVQLFYDWVVPGGFVTVTNVHSDNPVRCHMEYILEWNLVYRDERIMKSFSDDNNFLRMERDPTGINIFLDLRKALS